MLPATAEHGLVALHREAASDHLGRASNSRGAQVPNHAARFGNHDQCLVNDGRCSIVCGGNTAIQC